MPTTSQLAATTRAPRLPGGRGDWLTDPTTNVLSGLVVALQVGVGYFGVGGLRRFIPRTVVIGFVNALAILIFLAQIPRILLDGGDTDPSMFWSNLAFVAIGPGIIYGLPRITEAIPSPLVAIVVLAVTSMAFDYDAVGVDPVETDMTHARVWDTSAVVALDAVVAKYAERGISTELVGLNRHAEELHRNTSGRSKPGH